MWSRGDKTQRALSLGAQHTRASLRTSHGSRRRPHRREIWSLIERYPSSLGDAGKLETRCAASTNSGRPTRLEPRQSKCANCAVSTAVARSGPRRSCCSWIACLARDRSTAQSTLSCETASGAGTLVATRSSESYETPKPKGSTRVTSALNSDLFSSMKSKWRFHFSKGPFVSSRNDSVRLSTTRSISSQSLSTHTRQSQTPLSNTTRRISSLYRSLVVGR